MIVAFIIIIATIFFIDRKIKQSLLESEKSIQQSESVKINQSKAKLSAQPETTSEEIVVKLTPEDPAKYGMVVNDAGTAPRTAEGWENQLRETFEKQKTLDSEDAKKALKVAKTSETDYQKQMKDLDSHIELFQQKLTADPLDKDAEHQLQMLYQLKAVGKILKEKVVTPDISPAQNAVPTLEPSAMPAQPQQP